MPQWQSPRYGNPLTPITEEFISIDEFKALVETANDPDFTDAIIRKVGNKWVLFSHKGKRLGSFDSKEAAKKREKEIQFFKHSSGETIAGDTYHNRFSKDRKHNKNSKKFKPLPKKCSQCGKTGGQLDIDHKDGNRKNNNRSNLRIICRSCHRKMHAKRNGGKGSLMETENRLELVSQATIFEPSNEEIATAGFQNQDLMFVKFELCHTGSNKNTDGFISDEMSTSHKTSVNKPINWEHTNENIGVIYDSEFSEAASEGVIVVKAAIWKHKHPERARVIANRFADGDLYFSMETYFQKAKCSVCDDEFESSDDYCDHLNGRMQAGGSVTRWLLGLNFVGAGCVKNPADAKARGLAVAATKENFENLVNIVSALKLVLTEEDWYDFILAKHQIKRKKKRKTSVSYS
jgi:hypothetical protein